MKISGFTFVKNAIELDYPIIEAITSALPLVDEFWAAAGDSRDGTTEAIRAIGDAKINIIESVWDPRLFVHGAINAEQTNLALSRCAGDWCLYLQADEIIHEKFPPVVRETMERNLNRPEVEGLLFDYVHFWGSYETCQRARHWYRREVRAIRNGIGISSWKDAQGFRLNGRKLRVVHSGAAVYHYGWVRDPRQMKRKQIALDSLYHDQEWIRKHHPDPEAQFEYGSLKNLALFTGTHPRVMAGRIAGKSWSVPVNPSVRHEHNRFRNRVLTYIENKFLGGYRIGEYKNYRLIK